jgi:hypothetical protein
MEGFPMRTWSIEIYLLDAQGQEVTANCFDKAVYNLHPSFERPKQSEALPLLLLHFLLRFYCFSCFHRSRYFPIRASADSA